MGKSQNRFFNYFTKYILRFVFRLKITAPIAGLRILVAFFKKELFSNQPKGLASGMDIPKIDTCGYVFLLTRADKF